MEIQTEVLKTGAAQFNQMGQLLGYPLSSTEEKISDGLAKRLVAWAQSSLDDAGFLEAVDGWKVCVSTMDANDKPADRSYSVRWTNAKGGYIEVNGILTRRGWPCLDYGISTGRQS